MCGEEYKGKGVGDYDHADLPRFQKNITHHFAEGHYELSDKEEGRFSTLRELFEAAPGMYISIDMKDSTDELCEKVNALVKEFKREDLTFWGSMFPAQHALIRELNPNVSTFFSASAVAKVYLCWLCGCLWCWPLSDDAFMTTHMTSRAKARIGRMLERRGRKGCCVNFVINIARGIHLRSKGLFRHL